MMKFLVLVLLFLSTFVSFAQEEQSNNSDVRLPSLGISFFLNDFTTPQRIRGGSLSSVLREKQIARLNEMAPGIAVSYYKGLNGYVDFAGTLAGSFVNVPLSGRTSNNSNDHLLLEGDASLNIKLMNESYWFTPYIIAGIGASRYDDFFGAFVPLGAGFKVNFFNEAAFFVSSQYRVPVTTDRNNYHFMNSIGIAGIIGKKREGTGKTVEAQ